MPLHLIPWTMAGLTFVAINVCFVMAASRGLIPWCFPYVEGCVSISKAAREVPQAQIYRFAIVPVSVLMAGYWVLCARWLEEVARAAAGGGALQTTAVRRALAGLGVVAALGLGVNGTLFGDAQGDLDRARRVAVGVFFVTAILAQILFTFDLHRLVRRAAIRSLGRFAAVQVALCAGQIAFVAMSLLAPLTSIESRLQRVAEWDVVLLLLAFFAVTGAAWRATGFGMRTSHGLAPPTRRPGSREQVGVERPQQDGERDAEHDAQR